jgi:fructose-1,6-bisphosphatase I
VEGLTLIKGAKGVYRWIVTTPKFEFQPKAKYFSPEGVKTCYNNPAYLKVFEHYCINGYSIRYSSSFAADSYNMFVKSGGVYSSIESLEFGIKLRLLYECIPISFLISVAGGEAKTDNGQEILDIMI